VKAFLVLLNIESFHVLIYPSTISKLIAAVQINKYNTKLRGRVERLTPKRSV